MRAAFLTAILVINAGNYGLSINLFAFGEPGLARASLYFTVNALVGMTLGVYLAARGRVSPRLALRRVLGVPLAYAAVLGLVLNLGNLAPPEPLQRAIHLLGQASVPTMLLVLGAKLVEAHHHRQQTLHLPALGAVTVMRLLLAPAVAWAAATVIGLQGLTLDVVVLQSAMPTAVVSTILATEFETEPPFAALCVLVTTLLSLFTITLLLNWLA
jgi:predicted permease